MKIKTALFIFLLALFFPSSSFAVQSSVTGRPQETRLKACQAREQAIQNRTQNLLRMANNMVDVFSNISKRTEQFYATKVVPKGVTVVNYSELIAAVETKKEAVKTSLDKASNDSSKFQCESETPRASLVAFRSDMQDVKAKLKDLRMAVRNLIVAVHSANKEVSVTPGS